MNEHKKVVIKASIIIHSARPISLLQQKMWNLLLAASYDQLEKKDEHTIALSALCAYCGTRNTQHILTALLGLDVAVYVNIFNKNPSVGWGFFNLLDSIIIARGVCIYSFSKPLRALLYSPDQYAKIHLAIQKRFSSRYALFLYELCLDYAGIFQTPWIAIRDFRLFMGVPHESYASFSLFNQRVIKPAIQEVNALSDVSVRVEYKRLCADTTHVKFRIRKKIARMIVSPSVTQQVQQLSPEERQLCSFGVPSSTAQALCTTYGPEAIRSKIAMLKKTKTAIRNVTGWMMHALEHEWIAPEYNPQAQQLAAKRERETKEMELRQLRQEHTQFIEAEAHRRYHALEAEKKKNLDLLYEQWLVEQKKNVYACYMEPELLQRAFLMQELVRPEEKKFEWWLTHHKKVGGMYADDV